MTSKQGKRTGEFGRWLTGYLDRNSQYSVFYDHGSIQEDSNVGVIKGFYGHEVTNRNRISDVDVMVVNDDGEVVLLIEIEESEMSPKKLLGDVFATIMCNRFAVRMGNEQKYFCATPKTRLIVSGVLSSRGQDKIRNIIAPRLRQFGVPDDTFQIDNIKFVFGEDISEMITKLKLEMKNAFEMENAPVARHQE